MTKRKADEPIKTVIPIYPAGYERPDAKAAAEMRAKSDRFQAQKKSEREAKGRRQVIIDGLKSSGGKKRSS
jgi:hypothetical protein